MHCVQFCLPMIVAVLVVAVGTDVLVAVGTDVLVAVGIDVLVASKEDITGELNGSGQSD